MTPAFVASASLRCSVFTSYSALTSPKTASCTPHLCVSRRAHAPRMVQQSSRPTLTSTALSSFASFFSHMPGAWNSQRTYHYLSDGGSPSREESQTTFDVERLSAAQVCDVIVANGAVPGDTGSAQGFRVSFLTRMASQEAVVRAGTNLAFVPEDVEGGRLQGAYYRDVGYEESGPVKARFVFDEKKGELQMTTWYTEVVSVDEIRLVNDKLRLRRIVNYRRPEREDMGLTNAMLVGYGVEVKGEEERLVE